MNTEVWMLTSEMAPYAKTGGLGDAVGGLAPALARLGFSMRIFLPAYHSIPLGEFTLEPGNLAVPMGPARVPARFYSREISPGCRLTLVGNEELFGRPALYDDGYREYADNARRFIFFTRAVCELARRSERPPAIVHANDWQSALAPMLFRLFPPPGGAPRTVLTIHNLAYQGRFGRWEADWLGIDASQWEHVWRADRLEDNGGLNFLKAGIGWADEITTVSPSYAREILTPEHGQGLESLLRARESNLRGILNGVDGGIWNPATDPHLAERYDAASLEKKAANKAALRTRMGLPPSDRFLLGVVSRLTWQKGVDLLIEGAERILGCGADLVVLGSGEPAYVDAFEHLRAQHPERIALWIGFREELAHLVIAGSDAIAMPSRFEPCGLTQLYAMRYGTLPIVHRTGGLVDTVSDLGDEDGTGITFSGLQDTSELVRALARAVDVFMKEPTRWRDAQVRAMQRVFTWEETACHYGRLYERLLA